MPGRRRTPWTPPRQCPTPLVILVNGQWRNGWLLKAVDRRLREEFARLDLRLNEAKSRVVDPTQGEAFGFLGFLFRRLRSPRGRWWVQKLPAMKQRTALLRKLEAVFRRWDSRPVGQVIAVINPILRGWVNYFRIGNAARCFDFVRAWVEKKVRRHMMREGPSGLRLEAVEYGLDLHGARGLQGLPGAVSGPGLKARPAR